MAYNQQYILAGQMHQAQVIEIRVKIVVWPLKSVPKNLVEGVFARSMP